MQRSWRGKDKPRKKNKYRGPKGQNRNFESEDAFYEKIERQKRQKIHEQIDELEQFDELEQSDDLEDSYDWEDSDENEELEQAELSP